MPVYHSKYNEAKGQPICNAAILPLKTKVRGNAPPCQPDQDDIIDETIKYYRANVLHRNFQQEGPADLVLAYNTIYVGECIRYLQKWKTKTEGKKQITQLSHSQNFSVPGDSGFPLAGFFKAPANRKEQDDFRTFFRQLREETAERVIETIYNEDGSLNKWWMMFAKRKFMNIASTR